MTQFDKLVSATLRKINEETPTITLPNVQGYIERPEPKEPEDTLPVLRNQERNAGLNERDSKYSSIDYAFKNDVIQRKGKVLWVFSGPALGSSDSIFAKRKFKDITSLLSDPKVLEGQTFSGKFNDFKIVRIEPKEQQQRHEKIPNNFALYKAVPVK